MKNNYSLLYLWRSDLYRNGNGSGLKTFIMLMLFRQGYRYMFFYRLSHTIKTSDSIIKYFYPVSFLFLRHYETKYLVHLESDTIVGPGMVIPHIGGIVVSPHAVIGSNCQLMQCVTIGFKPGDHKGAPTIGNNVFIGPGAKVIGGIRIGNNVVIGANSVVTKDVPDNAVVAGVLAKILSYTGSKDYVKFTDYN